MSLIDNEMPLYTIGIAADLIKVHPETLRIWERSELIRPSRKNKQRFYSTNDIKRLQFIHRLINEKGLNLAGVQQIIQLYPCWWIRSCAGGQRKITQNPENQAKLCWKEDGTYCFSIIDKADLCNTCEHYRQGEGCSSTQDIYKPY